MTGLDLAALDLTWQAWTIAILAILFAAVLRGFTGFGFALAAVPLASIALPPSQTVAAVLVMQLGIGLRDCIAEWRQADKPGIARLTLGALLGLPLGVAALAHTPAPVARAVLGVLVLLAVALTWKPRPALHRPAAAVTLGTGFVSGVFHGLAAMAGPPAVAYYLAFEQRLPVMRSSLMVYFPIVSLLGLPMVASAGLLDAPALLLGLLGMPLMVVGGWIGARGFLRFGARSYRMLTLAALLFTAAASLARAAADLF
jgi:hypothetical protein